MKKEFTTYSVKVNGCEYKHSTAQSAKKDAHYLAEEYFGVRLYEVKNILDIYNYHWDRVYKLIAEY